MRSDIPDEATCLRLLQEYQTPLHIIRHSQMVGAVAKFIGQALVRNGLSMDISLIQAGSLLHDIGKYPCILEGTRSHDVRGEEIVAAEGYPAVARIVGQHVVLKTDPSAPVAEVHVVYYADKRVTHDELVTVEERFIYLERTYANNQAAVDWLLAMKERTIAVEEKIFRHLDFTPDQLTTFVPKRWAHEY